MVQVAVHIVTYNSASVIEQCLEALFKQQGDWTVQVVDNASHDNTCTLVRKWEIPIHTNSHNMGYAGAHNQALALTQSEYVLTLNPDVVLQPDFIVNMCAALEAHPEVGMAAGGLLRVDELGDAPYAVDGAGLIMRRNRSQGLRAEGLTVDERPLKRAYVFGADGATAFYRRSMLEDIAFEGQIFDDDFFMHKEDIDLCWRAQWRGWKALYVPDAVAYHVRSFRPGRRERVSSELRRVALRNRYVLMIKNDHWRLMWRDLPRILIYELGIWGYVLLRERPSLNMWSDLWRTRKRWLQKRAHIQSTRRVPPSALRCWFEVQEIPVEESSSDL